MAKTLLVAGSNSGYQLGVGHDEDAHTLQEALCRAGASPKDVTSFPPRGYTIEELSSGANHTLALLQRTQDGHKSPGSCAPKEIWIAGSGGQGQLGPTLAHLDLSQPVQVFTRLDLEACLQSCDDLSELVSSGTVFQPRRIECGWNCSYIALECTDDARPKVLAQDVLVSLGLYRHNTFGELGSAAASASDAPDRPVHKVSFAEALGEAGLDASVPFKIVDIAAGLRHAVAVICIEANASNEGRFLVVGWGSARQGQVGRIPKAASQQPGSSRRPGPAAPVVSVPQLIFDWKVENRHVARCRVRAGKHHTAVLLQAAHGQDNVGLHCIGSNQHGQLLDLSTFTEGGSVDHDIAAVTCNWNSTHLLWRKDTEARIFSCGNSSRGQLGHASSVSTSAADPVVSVNLAEISQQMPSSTMELNKLVSGSEHSLLLLSRRSDGTVHEVEASKEDKQVWGWGWNEHGNLAQGPDDEADRVRPVLLLNGSRSGAATTLSIRYAPLDVWAGCGTSFILAEKHHEST